MNQLEEELACLSLGSQKLKLVVVASTFMSNSFECVIGWSIEDKKLIRPVTNLEGNSWFLGTFTVGRKYKFEIVNSNSSNAIYPHKSEDIIVKDPRQRVITRRHPDDPPVPVQFTESQMYNMLFGSSVESVSSVFYPGDIYDRKYITEGTKCPSVGILQCNLGDIRMFKSSFKMSATRCRIEISKQMFVFPVKAQNEDALSMSLKERSANTPVLVLLGLARPFAGTGDNSYNPRRCYILVIGVIMNLNP